jgi:AcrR family transcriptional regulator
MHAEQREQQLLDVAEDLFASLGYEHVSMEDVARAAGVSRPVVYEHHRSKENLYLACVQRARAEYDTRILEALAQPADDPHSQVEALVEAYLKMRQTNPGRWSLIVAGVAVPANSELGRQLTEQRDNTTKHLAAAIQHFAPAADPLRVEIVAHALAGMSEHLGRWWQRNPRVSRKVLVAHLSAFAWDGLQGLISPSA